MLRKHYDEREAAYQVGIRPHLPPFSAEETFFLQQEVKEAAEEASRELTGKEKQEVQLLEKQKHANSKAKKLKKQIQEVQW